jgi:hypothetical protein
MEQSEVSAAPQPAEPTASALPFRPRADKDAAKSKDNKDPEISAENDPVFIFYINQILKNRDSWGKLPDRMSTLRFG